MDVVDCTFDGCSPSELIAIFIDPEFLAEVAHETPQIVHHADIERDGGNVLVSLRWTFPTDGAPGWVRRFLPAKVNLVWNTTWDTSDSVAIGGTIKAHSDDPYITFTGKAKVTRATDQATRWRVSGEVAARRRGLVPARLVSSGLETVFRGILTDEQIVAERWLARKRESGQSDK